MRNVDTLPRVSCGFDCEDGKVAIEVFRVAALAAGWTADEAEGVIFDATDTCKFFDDIGQFLYSYTTHGDSFHRTALGKCNRV